MRNSRLDLAFRMTRVCLGSFLLFIPTVNAQAQSKEEVLFQVPTGETRFLDLIDLEEDPGKQLSLIDIFMKQNPTYRGMSAIWSLAQSDCVQTKAWDRALDFGDKLLKLDPTDVEAVRLNLQAAEGKKDEVLAKRWKDRLDELTKEPEESITATSTINLPFVEGPDAPPDSALTPVQRNTRARREALAFNDILQVQNPAARLELIEKFPKLYPHSQHLNTIQYLKFVVLQEMKNDSAALQVAEEILRRDRTREDVLFFTASRYYSEKRNSDQVIAYSKQMLDLIDAKLRPENMSDADWEKQKRTIHLQAHYMTGSLHMQAGRFAAADSSLRQALTYANGDSRLGMLNSLAFVNYKMSKPTEAIRYYEQMLATPGPHHATIRQSIAAIKSEYNLN